MNKLSWLRIALTSLAVFFVLEFTMQQAGAQASSGSEEKKLIPRTPEDTENARLADRHIVLQVVATDASGKAISGLQQQDFTILDNDQPQKMSSFEALQGATADPPVEVILLADMVNTSFQRVGYERDQISKFLRQNNGQLAYPTTLIMFSDSDTKIQPQPTRDGNALANLLASSESSLRTINRAQGVYGAEERLQLSLNALHQLIAYEGTKPGRKLLVWISPGWPLLSGPRIEYSAKQQEAMFNWIAEFSNGLRTSRITLFAVDPLGTDGSVLHDFYYQGFLKGVRKVDQANSGNLALQVLATQSGGRVLNTSNDLTSEINASVADASAYYVMSFEAAPADKSNEYHSITVKIDKTGMKARTNLAYYGQP
ncbi:MAG TPA: VWA domain-containing protein [Pseudacidobacterium sp.]|jgi:VWFA-related protein|nr:VWA domain-containing protein [Pseudacidobacterium sp.]